MRNLHISKSNANVNEMARRIVQTCEQQQPLSCVYQCLFVCVCVVALHVAVQHSYLSVVRVLLQQSSINAEAINMRSVHRSSCLHWILRALTSS